MLQVHKYDWASPIEMKRGWEIPENELMDTKPFKTDADYCLALQEIETLMPALPGSPEGEKLDALVTRVEAYEQKHYPLNVPGIL